MSPYPGTKHHSYTERGGGAGRNLWLKIVKIFTMITSTIKITTQKAKNMTQTGVT